MTSVDQQQGLATARRPAAARLTLSVVIPCLNEAETIEECVRRARAVMESNAIPGEVVVADNGSTDGSAELAEAAGARVIHEPRRGYGSAYLAGFAAAKGTYVIMADADLTYDFNEIPNFLALLDQGADMVIGNRMDNIHPGAMPWLHRYVGNPVLSGFLNLLYRTGVRDAHCGMRGLRRDVLPRLALRTPGMEFASEMVIRAAKEKLDIRQVPIEYHPRGGESKLSTWRDGWRHLRFLLLHSPVHLFIIPGLVMAGLGILILALSLAQLSVFGRTWQIHSMIAGSLLSIVGTQTVALGVCARTYAAMYMGDRWKLLDRYDGRLRLEHGLLTGLSIAGVGFALIVYIVAVWANRGFGSLGEERIADLAATLIVVGMEIVFASCLLSIISLRREDR